MSQNRYLAPPAAVRDHISMALFDWAAERRAAGDPDHRLPWWVRQAIEDGLRRANAEADEIAAREAGDAPR